MSAETRLAGRAQLAALPLNEQLELRNLSFRYAGAQEPAIKGLNLSIRANTSVGLVGPSGCGKTTTVDMILGLLAPASGDMRADGVPITADKSGRLAAERGLCTPADLYLG